MNQFFTICLIGLAGALGALSRYGTSIAMKSLFGDVFPMGTLLVNVFGCFCIGFLSQLGEQQLSENTRLILAVGFLGALTTFSTFGLDTLSRFHNGQLSVAFANVALNVILGLGAVMAGNWLARQTIGPFPGQGS